MSDAPRHNPLVAYWQLLRGANVFTALSNVIAGFLIVRGVWAPLEMLVALLAASALLYSAGMVLNDAFDAEIDAVERPERPIPSRRVSRHAALNLGWSLLACGLACATTAAWYATSSAPVVVAACLALTIVLYDGGLKHVAAGPWAMGWCRTLNVLLGASVAENLSGQLYAWIYAVAVGLYTVTLTFIARGESIGDSTGDSADIAAKRALVKRMIMGFIVLDAAAATLAAGWPSGLAVLALLIPSHFAARWAPMT